MAKVRFNKENVLAHIENITEMLEGSHGERIKGGHHGITIMAPGEYRDRLMRAWGAHDNLNRLYCDIEDSALREIK